MFVTDTCRNQPENGEEHNQAQASTMPPVYTSPPAGAAPPSSPSRHLLTLIVDALQLPDPAATPGDETAYLALANRRAGLVLAACRRALAAPGDGGTLYAARDLYDAVSNLPATGYRHAPGRPTMSA